MHKKLTSAAAQNIGGSYLGWNYPKIKIYKKTLKIRPKRVLRLKQYIFALSRYTVQFWTFPYKTKYMTYLKKLFDYEWSISEEISKIKSGFYIVRIRILDPESGKFETNFFLKCIVAKNFCVTNFSLEWFLLWDAFMK